MRLYGSADLTSERQHAADLLSVGDYIGMPDMVQTAFLNSEATGLAGVSDFIIFALSRDYGDYSLQCVLSCLNIIFLHREEAVEKFKNP
ncbi:unnamed protein product [Ambrosiozyma monospora]|uniref:Unnamed protein product n=1 Tax=Ambrosiozyma monospora TaxID=43982 RepID=A0ACB5T2M7_AMBMO|nr:unnamed protein product [Ambrosiozyma monospora]